MPLATSTVDRWFWSYTKAVQYAKILRLLGGDAHVGSRDWFMWPVVEEEGVDNPPHSESWCNWHGDHEWGDWQPIENTAWSATTCVNCSLSITRSMAYNPTPLP